MKLARGFLQGTNELSKFLRFKFLDKNGEIRKYYKKSTIWPGIKKALKDISARSQWMIRNGEDRLLESKLGSTKINQGHFEYIR